MSCFLSSIIPIAAKLIALLSSFSEFNFDLIILLIAFFLLVNLCSLIYSKIESIISSNNDIIPPTIGNALPASIAKFASFLVPSSTN